LLATQRLLRYHYETRNERNIMKKKALFSRILCLFLIILTLPLFVTHSAAYQPAYSNVIVGIFYGANALPGANLQNVTGCGAGYEFGMLDSNRQFVPIGAQTSETKISMLRDRNMVYKDGQYVAGTDGSVVVGCFHIQLNTPYATYDEAAAQAQLYSGGFVKYSFGKFYVCVGEYLSQQEANDAIVSRGFIDASITSGTTDTVVVVATGTDRILLEYENGSSSALVVRPISSDGTKPQTWFRGFRYYGMFQYIRVGGGDLTVLNIVDIEDYVKGVLPYEMANTWPLEALKAQAVCARTYVAAYKGKHGIFDVCTTEDCQVYRGTGQANAVTDRAVDETAGQYLIHNGSLAVAYYSSSNGGASENSENVWPNAVPYLRGVMDPYEATVAAQIPNYSWTVTYTREEITQRLRNRGYNCGTIVSMSIAETTPTGNVFKITLKDENGRSFIFTKGEIVRSILGVRSIRFTINDFTGDKLVFVDEGGTLGSVLAQAYAIGKDLFASLLGRNDVYAINGKGEKVIVGKSDSDEPSDIFVIKGTGHGHNVGMSQWGAYSMALHHSMTYREILAFYFTGVTIE
jgi:stage II sporulation protein D